MRIKIVALDSIGGTRAYVALGLGLQQAGHSVQIATFPFLQELVSSWGLDFAPVECNNLKKRSPTPFGNNPFRLIRNIGNLLRPLNESLLPVLWQLCQDADAIVFNQNTFVCYNIAEKLGIPCYAACAQPHHQTHVFPYFHFPHIHPPTVPRKIGIYNWLTYSLFDQLLWQSVRQPINQWRQETLNLPPLPSLSGVLGRMQQQKIPCLYSCSPSFLPKPYDWPGWVYVTGYWFLRRPSNWQPPSDLIQFLAAGPPPIYIETWHEKIGVETVRKVLSQTKQRAIVRTVRGGLRDAHFPEDEVFTIKSVPHDWLFPQMAAVMHQGGHGTTLNGIRAGVPTVTIPYNGDQFLWARRVAQLGLGPSPIVQEQPSVEKMVAAIRTAINDTTMKERAAAIGKRIQAEDGVAKAVEAFHRHLPSSWQQHNV
ncbi:glycosyltransferase [Scytonema sp. UIC 10036]|uniref:glycosyltransferase n=1 Tax=Scytonema sp. UIC 10036 TaxID=2304196 RepID=UPI0012DA306F|nr:glycosyltransferase [Scytonema sp. UIC 10036]MUG92223.1 glycosyltransferase [Scytonema sp. UIC 10036]